MFDRRSWLSNERKTSHTWYELVPDLPSACRAVEVVANGVRCYWTDLPGVEHVATDVVLWMHGGANCMGSAAEAIPITTRLSEFLGQRVLSVEYRLAGRNTIWSSAQCTIW